MGGADIFSFYNKCTPYGYLRKPANEAPLGRASAITCRAQTIEPSRPVRAKQSKIPKPDHVRFRDLLANLNQPKLELLDCYIYQVLFYRQP